MKGSNKSNLPDIKTPLPGPKSKILIEKYAKLFGNKNLPNITANRGNGCLIEDFDGNEVYALDSIKLYTAEKESIYCDNVDSIDADMIVFATPSPAILNVFVGAVQVREIFAISSDNVAVGVCTYPPRTRSAWISSETMRMLFSRQISATWDNSSWVQTLPTGLCGLQRMRRRVLLSMDLLRWSRSMT